MPAHSSVIYVEPNMEPIKDGWAHEDNFERAPRLEEYCIAMNIEVEISSRDKLKGMSANMSDVLIMQWNNPTGDNGGAGTINFMGGTRIGGYNVSGTTREPILNNTYDALTTYYADMYVGDLINYGTTEMVGIKSVNIEYQKSCVPIITVVFTDVRGMSIFQPQEISRDNTYNGIKGINSGNVAQSFFQCFFKMPLPKFTIYIKGFYGKPVAYQVMCDKFDTNFNSDTGDFEVTTRFIGYAYSFLTDVSMDALIAAPYSDYKGRDYWNACVDSGKFYTLDKTGTVNKRMPTLCEIVTRYNELSVSGMPGGDMTTVQYEESGHEIEIKELRDIRDGYVKWYNNLYESLSALYNVGGEQRCFDFKDTGKDADYNFILLLTDSSGSFNMGGIYSTGLTQFHELNETTYNVIETYNKKEDKFKKLKNVSLDFTDFKRIKIFTAIKNKDTREHDANGNVVYGHSELEPDFEPDLPNWLKTAILNRLFTYHETVSGETGVSSEPIYDRTLSTIRQNGEESKQLLYGYVIKVDYSEIKDKVNALNAESNRSEDAKNEEKRLKELNDKMFAKMDFYPTIENFTRVMMAHFETFMHMMYSVANEIIQENRTLSSLGISGGEDGNAPDVNDETKSIPPFPRVTERVYSDGIAKNEDAWVGSFNDGIGFREVDIVNGLFNGIDEVYHVIATSDAMRKDNQETVKPKQFECQVPHPLSTFDFFLNSSPYGEDSETLNDIDALVGRIAIRMFDIISLSCFRNGGVYGNEPDVKRIAKVEALNFKKTTRLTNDTMLKILGTDANTSTLKKEVINNIIFNAESFYKGENKNVPWTAVNKERRIFSARSNGKIWMDLFSSTMIADEKDRQWYYPIQGGTFKSLEENFQTFIKPDKSNINKASAEIDNFSVVKGNLTIDSFNTLMESNNNSAFNTVYFCDDFNYVNDILTKSAPDDTHGEDYRTIYDTITGKADINEDINPFISSGVFREKKHIARKGNTVMNYGDIGNGVMYVKASKVGDRLTCDDKGDDNEYKDTIDNYYSSAKERAFGEYTITEFKGIVKSGGKYILSDTNSLFMGNNSTDAEINSLPNDVKCALLVQTISGIDYKNLDTVLNFRSGVFMYLPKIAVLQIGAAMYAYCKRGGNGFGNMKHNFADLEKFIPSPLLSKVNSNKKNDYSNWISYILSKMSPLARIGYAKYFRDWALSDGGKRLLKICVGKDKYYMAKYGEKRALLNENDSEVNALTSDLLSMVLVVKGSINYTPNKLSTDSDIFFNRDWVHEYFNAFLDKLRVLYGFKEEDVIDDNGVLRQASEPAKTTTEMRIELYRYLKLLYDKWIPTNPEESWDVRTFFHGEEGEEIRARSGGGHMFHFIDSYYNKVGNKLLINIGKLAARLTQLLASNDVNVMMLGFMADIYNDNRCMMMCIQNFQDMSDKNSMMQMFKPIPYNEMPSPNKNPDFVVVYPYEPSKNLDIDNGEFKDDGFMLNDEDYTPIAIKSRGDNEDRWYYIPAFGVTYGKQYQNYFKKVNVNMSSPIATQQSIMAKHAILRKSQGEDDKGTQGQDMYDIYSTQSYTCTVEMMGCAWVQPMMYFVLLNVPMFKGSYMIMKVTHSITPGNMITTFTGCRMAKTSNKLVEHIFTDNFDPSNPDYNIDSKRQSLADIDNNCGYKVFNLFESDDIELSGDETENGVKIMKKLISLGANKEFAAGIVGNMAHETKGCPTFNPAALNTNDKGYYSGGLCQFRGGNLAAVLSNQPGKYGQIKNEKSGYHSSCGRSAEVKNKLNQIGVNGQVEFLIKTLTPPARDTNYIDGGYNLDRFNRESSSPKVGALLFRQHFEISERVDDERWKNAEKFYKAYGDGTKTIMPSKKVEPSKASNKEIYAEFMRCLQLSVNSTDSGKVELAQPAIVSNERGEYIRITQKNGKRDKLPLVFDIILDGYYDYVQELWWVHENDGTIKGEPLCIDVIVKLKPSDSSKMVFIVDGAGKNFNKKFGGVGDRELFNEKFLKSLLHKFGKSYSGTELPQFPKFGEIVDNSNLFIRNCDDIMSDGMVYSPSQISPGDAGFIDGWNVGEACRHLISKAYPTYIKGKCGNCAYYVEEAIKAGGGPLSNKISCGENGGYATNLRYNGILEEKGFVMIEQGTAGPYGDAKTTLQSGDVAIIGKDAQKYGTKYHACMYCSQGWISDFKQKHMSPYDLTLPYAIYRFHNKKKE